MKNRLSKIHIFGNYSLLFFVIILVFIVPLFDFRYHDVLFDVFFTLVYFTASLSVERFRNQFALTAIVIMALMWISSPKIFPVLNMISNLLGILFFMLIVISFIITISKSKKVNARIILESINGYLLLGILFTIIITVIMAKNPEAFSFPEGSLQKENLNNFGSYIYYSLVTMSTLGYGDVLPVAPYAKSIATFMSVAGQLYIAVIIAMLVGKFAGSQSEN